MSIKAVNSIIKTLQRYNATLYVDDGQLILSIPGNENSAVLMTEYRLGKQLPQVPMFWVPINSEPEQEPE